MEAFPHIPQFGIHSAYKRAPTPQVLIRAILFARKIQSDRLKLLPIDLAFGVAFI